MATYNSVQLIGRLGQDPTFNVIPSGKPVAKFSLAIDQGKEQKPMWVNIVAWEKLAEIVEQYAAKGMQVFVQGRLQMRPYTDKEGVQRVSVEVIASTVQLLEKLAARPATPTVPSTRDDFDPFLASDELP
jgi:single-strand DNA-binding protein